MHFTRKKQVKSLGAIALQKIIFATTPSPTKFNLIKRNIVMMLSDKELEYLKELENNKEVVYLLNTRECELISKLIRSYKEIQRQLRALQISKEEG
jgi:hypothetical protein